MYSSVDCADLGQYTAKIYDNGLVFEMSIGEEKTSNNVPMVLPKKRYEEIFKKASEDDKALLELYFVFIKKAELKESGIYDIYPNMDSNVDLYYCEVQLNDKEKRKLSALFDELGYTADDKRADEKELKLGSSTDSTPNFKLSINYCLTDNGVKVVIPNESISYNSDFPLLKISLLPYFGADIADVNSKGYLFIPDGSGAVINMNQNEPNRRTIITGKVYGENASKLPLKEAVEKTEQYYLPVFGTVRNNNSALFGIIERGDANSQITAMLGRPNGNYYAVYPEFIFADHEPYTKVSVVDNAETTALTGRDDFLMGINIRPSRGSGAQYLGSYSVVEEAEALGANIIRTGLNFTEDNHAYDIGFADLALENGMQVLAVSTFQYYDNENARPLTVDEIDVAALTERYTKAATALKDKVAYYQLGNEMNGNMQDPAKYEGGLTAEEYLDCSAVAVSIYAANKAIKQADPNAKTIVNFAWINSGFIDAVKAVELDADTGLPATASTTNVTHASWDYIGLNWYSNGANDDFTNPDGSPIDYDDIIESLNEKYPDTPVIVTEANLTPISENPDGTINYIEDASWLEDFARYCYANQNVKGFFAFELYDQMHFSYDEDDNYSFNRESHFGLIDEDGNKKDRYDIICSLYGGSGVVDRATVTKPAMNNTNESVAVFSSELTEGTVRPVYSEGMGLTVENATTTDFTTGGFIEFDLFVEEAAAFKAALDKLDLNIRVSIFDANGGSRVCSWVPSEYIKNDGWNHISFYREAFFDGSVDYSKISKIIVDFGGTVAAINNYTEISGMKVAVTNICSTKLTKPENVTGDAKIVIDKVGYSAVINRKVGYMPSYTPKKYDPAINLASCESIEFDLYVDNLELFHKQTTERNLSLRVIYDSGSNFRMYNLKQYVTKQGWNHIVIKILDYDYKSY